MHAVKSPPPINQRLATVQNNLFDFTDKELMIARFQIAPQLAKKGTNCLLQDGSAKGICSPRNSVEAVDARRRKSYCQRTMRLPQNVDRPALHPQKLLYAAR